MATADAIINFLRVETITTLVLLSSVLGLATVISIWRNRNLPPGPHGLPWIGYFPFLENTPHLQLARIAKFYGDIMSFTVLGKTHIHLNTLDLIKEAFQKSEDFSGRDPIFSLINWIDDGKGITQTEGHAWKEQRQFFLQSIKKFGYGKLSLESHIHEVIGNLLDYVGKANQKPVDIHMPLSNGTSNVIYRMLAHKEFATTDEDFINVAEGLRKMVKYFVGKSQFWIGTLGKLLVHFVPPGRKELADIKSVLHRIVRKLIAEHKTTFDPNLIRDFTDCYLDELEKLKDKNIQGTSFSMDALQANNVNVLLEGTESVSYSVYTIIRELLKYPEAQQRIQKELDDVVGFERLPSWADRTRLPYTEATLYELERIVTPFPLGAFHSNPRETTLRGYRIPKRSMIISNLWSVHYDPKLWPEPEKFNPNRFLNSEGKCEKKEGLIIFGLGKRSCPGEPLAIMEIFLFITSLLQKFTLKDPGNNDPNQVNYRFIAIPRSR